MTSKGHSLSIGLHMYCIPSMDFRAVLDEDCTDVALPHLISYFSFVFGLWPHLPKKKKKLALHPGCDAQ